ncbi:MAG: protein kinase [Actinomycetota bacterium]|nr:protein kinase [Actinomycetota bacterium]
MAVVYLARQGALNRNVALKELVADPDPALAERFLQESQLAGSLNHPNVVTVHDYFEHEGVPYIAMEYLERGSLRPFVSSLTLAQAAGVLEGLLAGLAHAQSRGIVHRDLKPENLMVTPEGSVKIADFGIAKAYNRLSTSPFHTRTGTTIGTPTYMAPEQATAKEVGPWTDLYATGVIAYELLVGRVPFADTGTPMSLLWRHVNDPVPPPQVINPDLDPALSEWIERMLAKAPTDRPANAQAAWEGLEETLFTLLGPRWRGHARLIEVAGDPETDKPLTPAPFGEPGPPPEEGGDSEDVFVTYDPNPASSAGARPGAMEPAPSLPSETPARDRRGSRPSGSLQPAEDGSDPLDHPARGVAGDARNEVADRSRAVKPDETVAPRLRRADPPDAGPARSSLAQRTRSDARRPISQRWLGVVGVLLALAAGVAGVLLLRPQGESASPKPDTPTARSYRTPAYTVSLPSGWSAVCLEQDARCRRGGIDARRSEFVSGEGLRITVDRTALAKSGGTVTLASMIAAQEASLTRLEGYRRLGRSRVDLDTRPGQELVFTSNRAALRKGVAYAFKAASDAYLVTGGAPQGRAIRKTAKRIATSIRPRGNQ